MKSLKTREIAKEKNFTIEMSQFQLFDTFYVSYS